jgi:hypothetical protein
MVPKNSDEFGCASLKLSFILTTETVMDRRLAMVTCGQVPLRATREERLDNLPVFNEFSQ